MADTDEKTLEPTLRRRAQARAEGRVPRSLDFTSAGLLLGGLAVLVFGGGALVDFLAGLLTQSLGGQGWQGILAARSGADEVGAVSDQFRTLAASLAAVLLPPLALLTVLAALLHVSQTGILLLPSRIAPDASRINPLSGLRRMFSSTSGVRLTLGLCKLGVIAAVAFASLYQRRAELAGLATNDLPHVAAVLWELCLWTCLKIGSALLVLALVDYAFERWKHERELRMTPQELREELRNQQGDPQLLARRRQLQRQTGERLQSPASSRSAAVERVSL
ncbi:MAG: EscU/YscU/HrcU family type III secretion system export apparatus switch protein [Pirellulales bacterium]